MQDTFPRTISLLACAPAIFNALLRDLPENFARSNEGPNTWSAFDVVAHLNHCERANWMPRARMILESGETRAFTTFDREDRVAATQGNSLPQLLDEFARLRSDNLRQLQALNLQPADLEKRGQHPTFGPVTLSQLLSTWAAHDLTHLHQLSRIMAHQYREAVGPWSAFLGVLQCTGHSVAA